MSPEFQQLTAFFHQDAMLIHDSVDGIVKAALSSMSESEVARLRDELAKLENAPSHEIERIWNSSRADFWLRGKEASKFVSNLIEIIDKSPR